MIVKGFGVGGVERNGVGVGKSGRELLRLAEGSAAYGMSASLGRCV
jgi:hypothetical protein